MPSWKVMLLATAGLQTITFLPCSVWPWMMREQTGLSAKWPSLLALASTVTLALWCESLATRGRDDVRTAHGGRGLLGAQSTGLALLLVIWSGLLELGSDSTAVLWPVLFAGVFAAGAGIALRTSAIASLGSDFHSEHFLTAPDRLQTKGLYAWMRHPSETGLLLLALGCGLVLQSSLAVLVVAIVLWPLVILRLRAEEVVLRRVCGAAHEQYCLLTPLLMPRLFGR